MDKKIIFVTVDSKSFGAGSNYREKIKTMNNTLERVFPDHKIVLLTSDVSLIQEYSDGKLVLLYDGPNSKDMIKILPKDTHIKGNENCWWEDIRIKVDIKDTELDDSIGTYHPSYQTNIYDYLKEKKE